MTDFSTLDNTLDSNQQVSLLLFRNHKRPKIPLISRSLSPKAKRDLAFPQNSLLKNILQSAHENKFLCKMVKIQKKPQKIPEKLLIPSEILNLSSNSLKSNGLRSNVLCLFNNDLKLFLEKKVENSEILKETISHQDQLVFLHNQNQNQRQLTHIFEQVLMREKDLIFRDLLRAIKQEFEALIRECHQYIMIPKTEKGTKIRKNADNIEVPSFETYLETLLQVYDIDLNEKEQFGILRPEKQELEKVLSRYQRFSKDDDQKRLLQKIEKKIGADFESILRLTSENNMLKNENKNLSTIKEKVDKDSGETFRLVQERLKLMDKRSLEHNLSKEKNSEKKEETANTTQNLEEKLRTLTDINDSLSNENLGFRQHNEILLKKIARLQLQIKKMDMKKDKICMNKETEVTYFSENPQNKPIKSLRYLLHYPSLISQTQNYSYKWCLIIINLIYSHKILQDVTSDYESFNGKSLKELILDFFVSRFKSKFLIEAFLRDFITNLRKYAPFSQRIKTFCQLSGVNLESLSKLSLDLTTEEFFPYNATKSALFTNKWSTELFLRLIYQIRVNLNNNNLINTNSNNTNTVENIMNMNKSFLSFEEDEALGVETAKNLVSILITQEGLNENMMKDFGENFQNVLETDLYERITNYNEEVMGNSNKQLLQNSNAIRIDFFLKFLMDLMSERRIAEYQQIFTLIKLQKVNKPEMLLNFTDFAAIIAQVFPNNKSVKLIENCFIELIDELNEENRFNVTFKNMVLGSGDILQKSRSSFSFNKIINIPNKQWKNANEIADACKSVFWDWRSELGIIVETYKMFKGVLFQVSRNNQKLYAIHEEFLNEIKKINNNIMTANFYDENWIRNNKTEFLKNLEEIWGTLLELLENSLKENVI